MSAAPLLPALRAGDANVLEPSGGGPVTRMLVSVRNVEEAFAAAAGGADFIDLKEPRAGALGGLPVETIAAIVIALRHDSRSGQRRRLPISATIGDWPADALAQLLQRVSAVAVCGVDYVKVGIERNPAAPALLQALAGCGHAVVPVFIADRGLDFEALRQACRLGFPALMVDTADKSAGSLFDLIGTPELRLFLAVVRDCGALAGLAGALRMAHLPELLRLGPDFAGFRSAVCSSGRGSALEPQLLDQLAATLRAGSASN